MSGSSWQVKVIRIGEPEPSMKCDAPEIAREYWREVIEKKEWFEKDKEALVVILLIVGGAYGFILMHNHPSGDPSPSQSDHSLTRRLAEGADLLQVKLLDHVIVGLPEAGRSDYFSFKEAGCL